MGKAVSRRAYDWLRLAIVLATLAANCGALYYSLKARKANLETKRVWTEYRNSLTNR